MHKKIQVAAKYSKDMMRLFTDIFQWLPLAHVIGTKVLVLHGGLFSKDETCLADLRKISRHQEPPDEGPMTEMLWYGERERETCLLARSLARSLTLVGILSVVYG